MKSGARELYHLYSLFVGTVGKFCKNSSNETPASKLLSKASTGTRVPVKTGVRSSIFRSTVIGSEAISFSSITNDILSPDAYSSFSSLLNKHGLLLNPNQGVVGPVGVQSTNEVRYSRGTDDRWPLLHLA